MNIFYTSDCPTKSALWLDDKRVVKMCLETAQLLSTGMHQLGSGEDAPYKQTHVNHPSSVWARSSRSSYLWLCEHLEALGHVYTLAFGKTHKSTTHLETFYDFWWNHDWDEYYAKAPPNCTTIEHINDVQIAYRMYMVQKWANDKRTPTWKNREQPQWLCKAMGVAV